MLRVLYDHRGRGASDRPATLMAHRIEEYVADVAALADELGASRYALMGYSWGAAVGLHTAARDARLCSLISLGYAFDPPSEEPAEWAYHVDRARGMADLVDEVERGEHLTLPDWLRDEFLSTNPEQFTLTLEATCAPTCGICWRRSPHRPFSSPARRRIQIARRTRRRRACRMPVASTSPAWAMSVRSCAPMTWSPRRCPHFAARESNQRGASPTTKTVREFVGAVAAGFA